MPRQSLAKALFLIVLALGGTECGIAGPADAADLLLLQRPHGQAAAQSPRSVACCAELSATANTRGTAPAADVETAKNARAAQAQFHDLRVALEREMSLHEVVPKDRLAALEGDMRRLSAQLHLAAQSDHLPLPSRAEDALNLAQDWYQASLRVINPPSGGVTELPLPTVVSDKADLAAAALDRLLEEVTAHASALQPVRLPKKRDINGLRPARSTISQPLADHRG